MLPAQIHFCAGERYHPTSNLFSTTPSNMHAPRCPQHAARLWGHREPASCNQVQVAPQPSCPQDHNDKTLHSPYLRRRGPPRTTEPAPPLPRRCSLTSRRPSPPALNRGACLLCKTRRPSHPRSRNETQGSLLQKLLPQQRQQGELAGAVGRWASICGHLYPSCVGMMCENVAGGRYLGHKNNAPPPSRSECLDPLRSATGKTARVGFATFVGETT